MKYFRLFIILFVIPLVSCSSDDPVKVRNSAVKKLYRQGTVKVAVVNSLEQNPTEMWNAALLAQEKINEEKIMKAKLELVKFDDGGTVTAGTKTAYEIAADNDFCAVVGHAFSDISLPCSLIYQFYGLLNFNFISTVHELTERNNPYLVSNMPDDNDFGNEVARLCDKNNYKNVLIYYLENTSGISISNAFELACNNFGIDVVNRESFDLTTTDKAIARSVKKWKNNFIFDAVFIAGRMPLLQEIIMIIRDSGITCPIVGADPFDDPALTENLSDAENGNIFCVSNYNEESDNVKFMEFYDLFKKKYGAEPDQEALQIYDALFVLAKSIAQVDTAVPAAVAKALHGQVWNEAAGPYSFDEDGAIKDRKLTVKVFKDGKFEEYSLK